MKKILVVIGEASGDLHAGRVLSCLKKIRPDLELIGTGGAIFQTLSKKTYYEIEQMEVLGWWEVLKKWQFLKSMFTKIVSLLDSEKPDALFLVDYVGFNLRLARAAQKKKIPVYFYIAPQVWAWKKSRVVEIAENITKLIVLFPFEVQFFAKENIQVECFGHPLLESVKKTVSKASAYQKHGFSTKKKLICLFAGSRKQELTAHLPTLFQTAKILAQKQNLQFALVLNSNKQSPLVASFADSWSAENIKFIIGDFYDLAGWADLALAASGTVTLELAILETPTIIFYRTSYLNYLLAKYCFGIRRLGLPNIVCGEDWLPEMVQGNFQPQKLAKKALEMLEKGASYDELVKNFPKLKSKLIGDSSSPRAKGVYQKTAEFLANRWR